MPASAVERLEAFKLKLKDEQLERTTVDLTSNTERHVRVGPCRRWHRRPRVNASQVTRRAASRRDLPAEHG